MQEEFIQLENEWVDIEDIATIQADDMYYIQNRGPDRLIALESETEPTDEQDGVIILPYVQAVYRKGEQKLYLRAFSNLCSINITKAE